MFDKKLCVLARANGPLAPMVPDPHGSDASPQYRRIIGRSHKEIAPGQWGWVPSGKPETLPFHHDIVRAIKDGDLWAADEATAKIAGVQFDPNFGGESALSEPVGTGGQDDV